MVKELDTNNDDYIDNNLIAPTIQRKITTTTRVTDSYLALSTDERIFCDTDGTAITVTLPAGVDGTMYQILNVGSSDNDVTITPDGSEKVNGSASETLYDSENLILTYETTEGWW